VTVQDLLKEAAEGLDPIDARATGDEVLWQREGRAFAVSGTGRAEFRLPPVMGRAALGTPGTSASERGTEWVVFAPPDLDRTAVDRVVAWFAAAWRHAAE
jgi:hypothetical protein